jgi:hypothetical protein
MKVLREDEGTYKAPSNSADRICRRGIQAKIFKFALQESRPLGEERLTLFLLVTAAPSVTLKGEVLGWWADCLVSHLISPTRLTRDPSIRAQRYRATSSTRL